MLGTGQGLSRHAAEDGDVLQSGTTVWNGIAAPTATPTPPEPQETIRVSTEEVRIPVLAYDEYGHFDPTLTLDDILVLEDGAPQQIRSLQRIPASILLLLCTSGDADPAMRTNLTRDIALNLVARLNPGDQISLFQFTNRTELLQGWTAERALIERALRTKIHSGHGSRLAPAIVQAATALQMQPFGSRHVVIIGDGVDVPAWANYREMMKALTPKPDEAKVAEDELKHAIQELSNTRATVHVISYQQLAQAIFDGKRQKDRSPASDGIRFDPAMGRLRKAYQNAMQVSGQRFNQLADETGGRLLMGESSDELIEQAKEVARDIGSEYVITYKPTRPLASAAPGEYRQLTIVSRRVGLRLRARRSYLVNSNP